MPDNCNIEIYTISKQLSKRIDYPRSLHDTFYLFTRFPWIIICYKSQYDVEREQEQIMLNTVRL